jgi:hypothetical protein
MQEEEEEEGEGGEGERRKGGGRRSGKNEREALLGSCFGGFQFL